MLACFVGDRRARVLVMVVTALVGLALVAQAGEWVPVYDRRCTASASPPQAGCLGPSGSVCNSYEEGGRSVACNSENPGCPELNWCTGTDKDCDWVCQLCSLCVCITVTGPECEDPNA